MSSPPHILNCSQTLVFLVFHRPDIVQFSSDAFNVTKTNQTLLICVTVRNRCHLHHSTFRLYSEKGLGLLLNVLFFFFPTFTSWSFFHLSRSTFCFSFQLHILVPVQEGPQADPVKVPLTDFQAAKLKLKTIPTALCTVCFG